MPTPARTSQDDIVTAGRAILEAEGVDAVTMQRVATAVGVRAPSLYKRVRSRSDLVRLVIEDLARDLAQAVGGVGRSGDPGRDLAALATAFRAFAHAHPRSYNLLFGPLPEDWRPALSTLAPVNEPILEIAGRIAGPERSLEAARTVAAWAHGFVSMELAGAFRLGGDVDAAFAYGIDRLARVLRD